MTIKRKDEGKREESKDEEKGNCKMDKAREEER